MNFAGKIVGIKKYVDSQAVRISCGRSIAITVEELYATPLDSKYALYKR
jgi:folate-dependent tRNA-U54 methylase TrmFO/GidA